MAKRRTSLLNDPFLDKEQLAFARAALRRASYRWPPRNEAIKRARVGRGIYVCEECKGLLEAKEVERDHKVPVIRTRGKNQTLGEFAARLFAPVDGWTVLCNACHRAKTDKENLERRRGIGKSNE